MRSRLVAVTVAAVLVGVAVIVHVRMGSGGGAAPSPRLGTGPVELVCGPEAADLCRDEVGAFDGRRQRVNGRVAEVRLTVRDTPATAAAITSGTSHPLLWMPSASSWLDQVNAAARERTGRQVFYRDGQYRALPVALSPLVVAAWSDRVPVLERACGRIDGRCLHDAVTAAGGWKALGGPEGWGAVKLAHAHPLNTGDGPLILGLVATAYRDRADALTEADVDDPGLQAFLVGLERAATLSPPPGDAARDLAEEGPAQLDMVIAEESAVVAQLPAARARFPQGLRILYPPELLLADHPLAVLVDDRTSAEDKDVGLAFRDFVASPDGQDLVARLGFRPGIRGTTDPAKGALAAHVDEGVVLDLPAARVSDPPALAALNALAALWRAKVDR